MRVLLDYETDNGRRGLGDVLLSTPVIQALAEKYSTRIDVVLRKEAQPLLFNNPYVRHSYETANGLNHDLHLVLGMKVEDYRNPRNRQPRVDSMAELFGITCINKLPQLYYPKQEKIPNTIGVSIESTSPTRAWLYGRLKELFGLIDAEWHVYGIIDVGLPDRIHNHLGRLSIKEIIFQVAKMERFLTVDSFFSHLTAALNIPTLVLYTNVPAKWRCRYYPLTTGIQSPIGCAPCLECQNGASEKCSPLMTTPCVTAFTTELVHQYLNCL